NPFLFSDTMAQVVFISGTPTVGKTTISEKIADDLNANLIKINDLAIENGFVLGIEEEKGYKVIDIDKLDDKLQEVLNSFSDDELVIVEGHLSHLCSNPDCVIILRAHPKLLKERLASRNYSQAKINENLEAEALGVCAVEAFELHGDKVNELDVTDLAIDEIADIIKDIISGKNSYPVGNVDFMDWIVENS
ncbi:adenylate kinase family protein, partial [Methanobrevibacter woesei]|uniref:adenylate kinase family protein n=1 Tax=Methanobrevibacter woesei TaxID=190976 RepID=UPI0032E9E90A